MKPPSRLTRSIGCGLCRGSPSTARTILATATGSGSSRSMSLGVHHALVAAILAYEAGIGVRSGCFCAQPYVMRLLQMTPSDQARRLRAYLAGDRSQKPGMVRISLGAYNVREDIDDLIAMLQRIAQNQYEGRYVEVPEHGNYRAAGDAGALVRCV